MQAGDKIFGNFNFGTFPTGGNTFETIFDFQPGLGDHRLTFNTNLVGAATASGLTFQVAVLDPAVPGEVAGAQISDLQGDLVFNTVTGTIGTVTLNKTTTATASTISCTRAVAPATVVARKPSTSPAFRA